MKTIETKCDACGADLGDAGAMPAYRLVLSAERRPNSGGVVNAVCVDPPIKREHHFCGLACLRRWADTRLTPQHTQQPTAQGGNQ